MYIFSLLIYVIYTQYFGGYIQLSRAPHAKSHPYPTLQKKAEANFQSGLLPHYTIAKPKLCDYSGLDCTTLAWSGEPLLTQIVPLTSVGLVV